MMTLFASRPQPRFRPLADQVVVVLGASSGIGRETARRFGAAGAKLVLAGRNESALRSLAAEIGGEGQVAVVMVETSIFEQVQRVAEEAVRRFGRIDTWVQNAATPLYGRFEEIAPEEFKRVIDVNLVGAAYGAMVALPHLRANANGGTFIVTSSVEGEVGIPYQSAYGASKHGVEGWTKVLRMELAHDGVPVQIASIKPAGVNTPFYDNAKTRLGVVPQPPPPVYQPGHVAAAIVFAATHPVRDFYVGGAGKMFSLGQRFAPALTEWFLRTTSFKGQRTDRIKDVSGPDGMFAPSGESRTHGDYGAVARRHSVYVALRTRPLLWDALQFLGIGLVLTTVFGRRRRRQRKD